MHHPAAVHREGQGLPVDLREDLRAVATLPAVDRSGGPEGGNGGDGGGMPGDMGGFFGGGSDMEDRMNQENITLDEDDVDDIETFVSGISAATISYMTRSTVDGGDLDEAQTYSIAGVKDSYAAISNLSLAVGDFTQNPMMRIKKKSAC